MKPDPRVHAGFTICDPACGTGGFLVAAYEWLLGQTRGGALDRETASRVRKSTYHGQDLVARPRRLALMNLYLHNIEPHLKLGDAIYEPPGPERFDVILTNPPFGTRGANQAPDRDDFTIATSNKQLNFVQHILTILKPGGRAAGRRWCCRTTACSPTRRARCSRSCARTATCTRSCVCRAAPSRPTARV
jgi:type I restriction enzyme M protein